ncbi:alkaline phosphatase PhoX [Roseiconus lacunae]|uniref:alkaline phosphatase PhoX n=1 Tax=Roseiconus lacunae TaxID=2605694 RepID=UPI0030895A8D|nr:alkaline phosphatase PhoX [Stieleria sp. HD01]
MKSRREFLSETFSSASGFGVAAALSALGGRVALGDATRSKLKLVPAKDETTGLELIHLPEGFRYISYGWTRDPMSDGNMTPAAHDGMGVVDESDGIVTIVRNHEISDDRGALSIKGGRPFDRLAGAGCTTLKFDTRDGQWLESRVSISGTSRNCAGGVTPWGTWLTAEETVLGIGSVDNYETNAERAFEKNHGWIFEVDPSGVEDPVPLKAMGRFVHEAVAFDRKSGIVYETEDRGTAGFYRFIPKQNGNLAAGGKLQVAEVVGQDDLRGHVEQGAQFDVRWHTIPEPTLANTRGLTEPDELGVFKQGKSLGGTTFARLEGCWSGNGGIYFDATSGGEASAGQIWKYDPESETLTMLFESPGKETLNMPDNLCVNPHGGLVLCEDGDYGDDEYPQRMHLLSQEGALVPLALNDVRLKGEKGFKGDYRGREWAGATFSPDGEWLFANIQTPGFTVAITGPWESLVNG